MTLLHRLRLRLRRTAVLVTVGALLAPLAVGAAAGVAVADEEPTTLAVDGFSATGSVTRVTPDQGPDPQYGSDEAYTLSPATGSFRGGITYRCAGDAAGGCADAALVVDLGAVVLSGPVTVADATVTYRRGGTTVTDPTQATSFTVAFTTSLGGALVGLTTGDAGTAEFAATLAAPAGGGEQRGTVVVTPSTAGQAGTASRISVTGQFPVNLATTTQVAWARTSYLSGVSTGTESPTNAATVTARLTGDPAGTFTVTWGGSDPAEAPAAGTAGMLTRLTRLTLHEWPQGAATATATGYAWAGAGRAATPVPLGTATGADGVTDLLAGAGASLDQLTGVSIVFSAADGGLIASGARAVLVLDVAELGSSQGVPHARSGVPAYTTTGDLASDANTLTVSGTATSSAQRGTGQPSARVSGTASFRVWDPRAYAGSSTAIAGLSSGTQYGGAFVRVTSGATNWTRQPVDRLALTARPTAAQIAETNQVLSTKVPGLGPGVFGSGLSFAGFGAGRDGDAGDGSGAGLSGVAAAGLSLVLTVTSGSGADAVTSPEVRVDLGAGEQLPTAASEFGLGAWSEVTGFTATLSAASGGVPMGAGFTVPYLMRSATSSARATYVDHTLATAAIDPDNVSSVAPRTAASGNRPITSAQIVVEAPTMAVSGRKDVVAPYAVTQAGRTTTAVLSITAPRSTSGHVADTLTTEDSARLGGGAAWWDVFRPTAIDTGSPAGVDTRIEYYTNTGTPEWTEYLGDPGALPSQDWRGFRLVQTRGGDEFAAGTTLRSRVTFAVRSTVLGGREWRGGTEVTNAAAFTAKRTVEGFDVTATTTRTDTATGVEPDDEGRAALVKVLPGSEIEGTGAGGTATLTWGTDTRTDLGTVAVTDAGGVTSGTGDPATGRDASFWDTFDLTGIAPIATDAAPGTAATPAGAAYDPYLIFDQVTDVLVYDVTPGAAGWRSLATLQWDDATATWVPAGAARTDVTFGAATRAQFPYRAASPTTPGFPGMTVVSASLRERIGGVQLVYEARTDDRGAAALAAAGDWRTALLPTLAAGAVAGTDGPARQIRLGVALRDTSRADGAVPVNDAHAYTGSEKAGLVSNTGWVSAWTGPARGGAAAELGGPVNDAGEATFAIEPAHLAATIDKTWTRDSNGDPLQSSGSELQQLALPVDPATAPADAWPTATLRVAVSNESDTRVDALTLTEPRGIDQVTTLPTDSPFASFALTGVRLDGAIAGAGGVDVVVYRLDPDGHVVPDATLGLDDVLAASAADLADVVGLRVAVRGRIQPQAGATLVLSTRLLAHNRVDGTPAEAHLQVRNVAEAAVQDARVCAEEDAVVDRTPLDSAPCDTPTVVRVQDEATLTVADASLEAFGRLELLPLDVSRDTGDRTVTSRISVQNFGLSPADQLLVTDADPRYFNAVAVDRVTVDQLPSGADVARLEVLVRDADLTIGADGAYAGELDWTPWGADLPTGGWALADLAAEHGATAADVIGVRVRFLDTDTSLIPSPGQGYGAATLHGALRAELVTGDLPSAVGADGWSYDGRPELVRNPGEGARGEISNRVTAQALRARLTPSGERATADQRLTVAAGAPVVAVQKSELDAQPRKPGDHVRYRITVTNAATGPQAADLTGLVVTDRLPENGSLVLDGAPGGQDVVVVEGPAGAASPLPAPVVTADAGGVVLTFGADDRLAPGASVEILLWLRVPVDLSTTTVTNTATAGSASRPVVAAPSASGAGTLCSAGTTYDTAGPSCRVTTGSLTIGGANVYVSEEWVRDAAGTQGAVRTVAPATGQPTACSPRGAGADDRDWYRYPCAVVTTAGSTTQWQTQVTSRASVATDRLEMVTFLPTVGDYPAMDGRSTASRGSQWRPAWDGTVPRLVNAAGLPGGASVAVYTTTADYRRGGVAASGAFDPVPGTWSATALTPGQPVPAAQAARVTGFKFVVTFAANDLLSQGESVRVQWSTRTPLTGAAPGADAWSSFAFRVPADGDGRPTDVTSVPLKAGARFAPAAAGADPLVAVGDRVWLDADRDGRQSDDAAAEPGVPGVTVDVLAVSGGTTTYVASAETDAAGEWLVDGLPAGTYDIAYTLPDALAAQYRYTRVGVGPDRTVDSDAVADPAAPASAVDAGVVLGAGGSETTAVGSMPQAWQDAHPDLVATQVDVTHDAGLQWRPLAVGDRVWFDADRDGRQGAGEEAVAGATVRLLGAGDAVLATAVTGADGAYVFDALDPGTYRVEVELPDALAERWTFTSALVGDAAGDSDVLAASARLGRTAAFTLTPAAPSLAAVSDLAGDPVWAGVDADYADPTQDAGLAELPVRVGDRVWVDLDGDGVQDAGEPGLAGVVLTLSAGADGAGGPVADAAGATVGPVTTDADGAYAFTGLLPGAYTVTVDAAASAAALAPYLPTVTGAGDPATDSSAGSASTAAPLVGGQADDTLDFGFRPLWALGDRVWLDADRDGVQDAGEPSSPGVTVVLLDAGGAEVARTATDADGRWRFDLLEPGTYRVAFELDPADAARYAWTTARAAAAPRADADSDADETGPGAAVTPAIAVGPGTAGVRPATAADGLVAAYLDDTWDAGLVERPVAVGDRVWFDEDLDGIQDAGEPGVPGVVVALRATDGRPVTGVDGVVVAPVTTDADGAYAFAGLLPGEYVVRIDRLASADALAGYAPTVAGAGADRAVDSSTWSATSRVLVGGELDTTLDFGLVLADDVQLALRKVPVARTADSITWDVTVMSTGTQDAYAGFSVIDALPGALTFRTASGTGFACEAVDRVVTCDHDGSLPAGESATVRIVTGLTAAGADVTNTATVDVEGRGYRFEVLAAEDVAWSEPVERAGGMAGTAGDLATTGSDAAWPLAAAGVLLALGAALIVLARGPVRGLRAAGGAGRTAGVRSRHRA